jgi:type II secretory pathway pseudopilin PulG
MFTALQKPTRPQLGVTLVELLVVVTILVLLLGVALPLARPAMEGRNVREAARQVSTFLLAAQAKAISTNRPVGVMFLRDARQGGNPNRCFQLALATTAAVYTGDDSNTRAVTAWNDDEGRWELAFKVAPDYGPPNIETPDINDVLLGSLIRPGETFEIRFDGRGGRYQCLRHLEPNDNVIVGWNYLG